MSTINNSRSRYFSAGLAFLSLTGILAGSLVMAAPAQADPPRHAPAWGRRDRDNDHRRNDRRDDRRDNRRDDRRDDRRDRSRWDNNNNNRFRVMDRDRDGTPDRYDRFPTNPRRR